MLGQQITRTPLRTAHTRIVGERLEGKERLKTSGGGFEAWGQKAIPLRHRPEVSVALLSALHDVSKAKDVGNSNTTNCSEDQHGQPTERAVNRRREGRCSVVESCIGCELNGVHSLLSKTKANYTDQQDDHE